MKLLRAARKLRRLRPRHARLLVAWGASAVRRRLPARAAAIQLDADPELLARLLEIVHRAWARHAASDPYLWVLTRPLSKAGEPLYQGKPSPALLERFYATGAAEADAVSAALRRFGATRAHLGTLLEFGCGLGRVSRWLCQDFDRVIGVDLSERYLDLAALEMRARGVANFQPIRITGIEELAHLPGYDVLYSRYVLQHNPPPVIKIVLGHLLRLLNPDGFAIFQVPTAAAGYGYSVARHLATVPEINTMEMHVFPMAAIRALARAHGCEILEMFETDDVGALDWKSHTFILRKTKPGS